LLRARRHRQLDVFDCNYAHSSPPCARRRRDGSPIAGDGYPHFVGRGADLACSCTSSTLCMARYRIDAQPVQPLGFPHGSVGSEFRWLLEASQRDADSIRMKIGLPVNGGAAIGTEEGTECAVFDRSVVPAHVAGDANLGLAEVDANADCRPGTSLTGRTMANDGCIGFGVGFDQDLAA